MRNGIRKPKSLIKRMRAPRYAGCDQADLSRQICAGKIAREMDALRAEIVTFQKQLDDPTLYARDAEQFAIWAEKLSQARDRLEMAEEEWLARKFGEEIENGA